MICRIAPLVSRSLPVKGSHRLFESVTNVRALAVGLNVHHAASIPVKARRWYSAPSPARSGLDRDGGDPKKQAAAKRTVAAKPTLRRAALKVQTSRLRATKDQPVAEPAVSEKVVTAYCGAQDYDMMAVARILRFEGVPIDPTGTSLYPQVIHVQMPADPARDLFGASLERNFEKGDLFIFPSGTVVAWNVPESSIKSLILEHLKSAAHGSHQIEDENFEYIEDSSRERSSIKSGVIILGTKTVDPDAAPTTKDANEDAGAASPSTSLPHANTVLAQVAFSSGLARSTKIAVLENQLDEYLEDTRDIPQTLMSGHLASVTRSFIYQKMGQLLTIRGQLNLSSDLTDSVPDILWDTEAELGLESYYERISRELDTKLRIESLNQRMDYAHEIASILREELGVIREERDERKSTRLEWIIILLIAVEVGFGGWHLYQDHESQGVAKVRVVS